MVSQSLHRSPCMNSGITLPWVQPHYLSLLLTHILLLHQRTYFSSSGSWILFSRHLCLRYTLPGTLFTFPTSLLCLLQVSNSKPYSQKNHPDSPALLHFWNRCPFYVLTESRCNSLHIHIINFNTLFSWVFVKTLLSHLFLYSHCLSPNRHSPNIHI